MHRGRQAKLKAGRLLPWAKAPHGYRMHHERPRNPALVEVDATTAWLCMVEVAVSRCQAQLTLTGAQIEDRLERDSGRE
jgi:hypothetical protein